MLKIIKNRSLKFKLVFLNTLIMIFMVSAVLIFMSSISGSVIQANSKNTLMDIVEDNIDEIEYDDNYLDVEDVDFYQDNVRTLIYQTDGKLLAGDESFSNTITVGFNNNELTNQTVDGIDYYIYDEYISVEHLELIIRGVISVNEVESVISNLFIFAFISLPLFVLLSCLGSYFITTKALSPINRIITTANNIKNNNDLSLRIHLDEKRSHDEIYHMATTFDEMFQCLEDNLLLEKQFTSDVSHELRTPTAIILGECELALEYNQDIEEKTETVKSIQKQAIKMKNLINNLLDLSRLEFKVDKPELESTDLSELVTMICEESQIDYVNNVTIEYDIHPAIKENIDQTMMIRLISNLIHNAVKYNKQDGTVTIKLYKNNDNNTTLEVSDTGIGISKENISKIFERFYKVDASRTNEEDVLKKQSMGLGLAMVQQIAKIHQASIEVESELSVGSCFKIIFK